MTKQYRRGEMMWFAYMVYDEDSAPAEVPGTIPLSEREAKALCERHYEESNSYG